MHAFLGLWFFCKFIDTIIGQCLNTIQRNLNYTQQIIYFYQTYYPNKKLFKQLNIKQIDSNGTREEFLHFYICLGGRAYRDDSSGSDDGEVVTFIVGSEPSSLRYPIPTIASPPTNYPASHSSLTSLAAQNSSHPMCTSSSINERFVFILFFFCCFYVFVPLNFFSFLFVFCSIDVPRKNSSLSVQDDNIRASPLTMNQDKVVIPLPRTKKSPASSLTSLVKCVPPPMPPPRRVNSHLRFVSFHFYFSFYFIFIV